MRTPPDHLQTILDLESRHDQLLELLADLEKRVASVLAACQNTRPDVATSNFPQTPTEQRPPAGSAASWETGDGKRSSVCPQVN